MSREEGWDSFGAAVAQSCCNRVVFTIWIFWKDRCLWVVLSALNSCASLIRTSVSPFVKQGQLFPWSNRRGLAVNFLAVNLVLCGDGTCNCVFRAVSGALCQRSLSCRAAGRSAGLLCASQSTGCVSSDALVARKHPLEKIAATEQRVTLCLLICFGR